MKNLVTFIAAISLSILISLGIQAFFWALAESPLFNFASYTFMGWVAQIAYWMLCLAIGINAWSEE